MYTLMKGIIRNGPVEMDEAIDLPAGTEVLLTPETHGGDEGPVPPPEIVLTLAAMRRLHPLDIPGPVDTDLVA